MQPDNGEKEKSDKDLVDTLVELAGGEKFEIWRYFEERAASLATQLWIIGTWLIALISATLVLPFTASFVEVGHGTFVEIRSPLVIIVISIFGMALCLFAYIAVLDVRRHIEGNWRRGAYARTGEWQPAEWIGRKRHGWNVLVSIGSAEFLAFMLLLIAAFTELKTVP